MKQVVTEMDSTTADLIFDFKQTLLAKGFCEGGDSYYGKKGMRWWGAGVFTKPSTLRKRSGVVNQMRNSM